MAITSLVIGITYIALGLLNIGTLGMMLSLGSRGYTFIVSLVGLILGIIAVTRKTKRGLAVAGIILNAVPILGTVAFFVWWSIVGD